MFRKLLPGAKREVRLRVGVEQVVEVGHRGDAACCLPKLNAFSARKSTMVTSSLRFSLMFWRYTCWVPEPGIVTLEIGAHGQPLW